MSAHYLVRPVDEIFGRLFPTRPNTDIEDRAHDARVSFWVEYLEKTVHLDGIKHRVTPNLTVDLAEHVCDDLAGYMTTRHCVSLVRAALRDDAATCLAIAKTLAAETIKRNAEILAEDE